MKKILWSALMLAFLLGLPGCASVPVNLGDGYLLGQDDQFYFEKGPYDSSMAETENGYYFLSGPDSIFLYYMDKTTMKAAILCNKPNCLHADETDPHKVLHCNACLGYSCKYNMVHYNSCLYLGGNDILSGYDGYDVYSIYQISLDGTQKKGTLRKGCDDPEMLSFKYEPEYWMIHRGFLYFTVNDNGTVAGKENETVSTCRLYRLAMNHLDGEPVCLYEMHGVYEQTVRLFGYGNGIYWLGMGFKDGALTQVVLDAVRYNILDGKTTFLGDDITYLTACNGKLVYSCTDGMMYKCNPDGSGKEEIGKIGGGFIYCDGFHYIYCDTLPAIQGHLPGTQGDDNTRSLFIYDLQGALVSIINIGFLGMDRSYGGNGEYLFFPDTRSAKNEYGRIAKLWAIDKHKISEENPGVIKVFEFIPKSQFQGIIMDD